MRGLSVRNADLTESLAFGNLNVRDEIYKKARREARTYIQEMSSVSQSEKSAFLAVLKNAADSERARKANKGGSQQPDPRPLSLYRTIFEEKVRIYTSSIIRNALGTDTDTPWTSPAIQSASFVLFTLIRGLQKTKSRILLSLPIAIPASIFEALSKIPEAVPVAWWTRSTNTDKIIALSTDLVLDSSKHGLLRCGVQLFAMGLQILSQFGFTGHVDEFDSVLAAFMAEENKNVLQKENEEETARICYCKSTEVREIVKLLCKVDQDFGNELLLHLEENLLVAASPNEQLQWISYTSELSDGERSTGNPPPDSSMPQTTQKDNKISTRRKRKATSKSKSVSARNEEIHRQHVLVSCMRSFLKDIAHMTVTVAMVWKLAENSDEVRELLSAIGLPNSRAYGELFGMAEFLHNGIELSRSISATMERRSKMRFFQS